MKLNEIKEASTAPVELEEVCKAFPKNAEKAVRALQRSNRLTIGGMPWVDALELMDKTIQKTAKREGDLKLEPLNVEANLEHEDWIDIDELEVDEMQEVYLGYDTKDGMFYVGYDAWISDDSRNDAAEAAAHKYIKDNKLDEDELDGIVNKIYKELPTMVGLDFECSIKNGKVEYKGIVHVPQAGGFYGKGSYRQFYQKNDRVVDVRLD